MSDTVDPAGHRARAERCRRLAAGVLDTTLEERLLDAAQTYEVLALQLEWSAVGNGNRPGLDTAE